MLIDRTSGRVYLTIPEVSKRWGMTSQTVSQYHVKIGGLVATRVGTQLLVALTDMTYYEQHRLLPHCDGKIRKLKKFKKRIEKPLEIPAAAAA